jgi:hypothetical protein
MISSFIISWVDEQNWVLFSTMDVEKEMTWNILTDQGLFSHIKAIGQSIRLMSSDKPIRVYAFDSDRSEEELNKFFQEYFDDMIQLVITMGEVIYIESTTEKEQ